MTTAHAKKPLLIRTADHTPTCPFEDEVIKRAEAALDLPPLSVTQKEVTPPSGNKKDWMNLSDYRWPNPDTPDGLPYIQKDGEANPEAQKYDRPRFNTMTMGVLRSVAAWHVTQKKEYAAQAEKLMDSWFIHKETGMNPNLNFAHHTPGISDGNLYGLIAFCSALPSLLDAWLLLYSKDAIDEDKHQALVDWATDMLAWLVENPMSVAHAKAVNNHGSYHCFLEAYLMLFIGKGQDARSLITRFAPGIDEQINENGEQPHETGRTLSTQYSLYNLRALMSLALLADHVELDLWHKTRAHPPLKRALGFLYAPAIGQNDWPFTQIEPPLWWMVAPMCKLANHIYGPSFELERIPLKEEQVQIQLEPYSFLEGWEVVFAPSHKQHLPLLI